MFVYLQSQNRSYRSELPARRVGRSVRSFEIFAIRDVPKDERSTIWSGGRVARQRSAKPCTAVRIRFRPHENTVVDYYNGVLFFGLSYICHTSSGIRIIRVLIEAVAETHSCINNYRNLIHSILIFGLVLILYNLIHLYAF